MHRLAHLLLAIAFLAAAGCPGNGAPPPEEIRATTPPAAHATTTTADPAADLPATGTLNLPTESLAALRETRYRGPRLELVRVLEAEGITSSRVLQALRAVPRHEFVPAGSRRWAYGNYPLPIGEGQTISQPYIVALMTQLLRLEPDDKVLEVGTGSGYQAAVLALLAREVYTIEIVEPLGKRAEQDLRRLGYRNVQVRIGDGYRGWPEAAPFDAIVVTAAPDRIPRPLVEQLAVGGRLVIPVGPRFGVQELNVLTKTKKGVFRESVIPVQFVPMVGEIDSQRE